MMLVLSKPHLSWNWFKCWWAMEAAILIVARLPNDGKDLF